MKFKILILILTAFSTASAKKSIFALHKDKIQSLQSIYVLTDTTLIEDMKKKQIGLNLEYNQQLGRELFQNLTEYFGKFLNAQLIHSLASVGLYEQENVYIPDYQDTSNNIFLPVLDASIENPRIEEFKHALNPLVDRSYALVKSRKQRKKYLAAMSDKDFSRITKLGLKEDEAVLLLIATGTKVPTKKSVGQGVTTAVLTLGLFSSWQISANQFNAVLIAHDGELLWTDGYFRGGKVSKDKKQESFIKRLFKSFPVKPKKNKAR